MYGPLVQPSRSVSLSQLQICSLVLQLEFTPQTSYSSA